MWYKLTFLFSKMGVELKVFCIERLKKKQCKIKLKRGSVTWSKWNKVSIKNILHALV